MTAPNPAGAASGEVVSPFLEPLPAPTLPWGDSKPGLGDRLFRGVSELSGVLIIVVIGAIGLFLVWRAIPALARNKENFFTYGGNWITTNTSAMHFGIFDLVQVTVCVAL
ncbi:MAG: phosphate ABC transporter permease subunit PstC, partial [Mycobacterium sp.]|nr:phosphate ABC transporter permease subunit PstC [Mycobacterium sp.]